MSPSVDQGGSTVEHAIERCRARTVSELRLLNEHLPLSRRLDRAEIDRLADDLLFAVRETPKQRNASLLDKAVGMASGVLVQAIRRRNRRRIAGTHSR